MLGTLLFVGFLSFFLSFFLSLFFLSFFFLFLQSCQIGCVMFYIDKWVDVSLIECCYYLFGSVSALQNSLILFNYFKDLI